MFVTFTAEQELEIIRWGYTPGDLIDRNINFDNWLATRIAPLTASPFKAWQPGTLDPIPWLYGVHLVRKFASATVAAGGTGKSTLAITEAISLCLGRQLLWDAPRQPVKCWLYNLEDPVDLIQRRIEAVCRRYGIDMRELEGKLFINSGRDRELIVMRRSGGYDYSYPDQQALADIINMYGIGALFVDPFISAYDGDENSNKDVDKAAKAFNWVADQTGCAVDLIHHTGKSGDNAGNGMAGRGASSFQGAVRDLRTIVTMTADEAETYGIAQEDYPSYIRMDGAKPNLAKRQGTKWLKISSMDLDNGNELYPNGDSIGVIETWEPPGSFDGMTIPLTLNILDLIREGFTADQKWHLSSRGRSQEAWVGNLIMEKTGYNPKRSQTVADTWSRNGVIKEVRYETDKGERRGLNVNEEKYEEIKSGK